MKAAKLDELDRLRNNADLFGLLCHYARLGEAHLEAWHYRLMHLEGVEPPQMARLHGELIACAWVEQNTGQVPARYRITLAGWRAMKQAEWHGNDEEAPRRIATPKFLRKKRRKSEDAVAIPVATSETITSH